MVTERTRWARYALKGNQLFASIRLTAYDAASTIVHAIAHPNRLKTPEIALANALELAEKTLGAD
jgi:hypothetical protein